MAPTRAEVTIPQLDDSSRVSQGCMGKVKGAAQRTASGALKGGAAGAKLLGSGGLGAASAFKDFLLETDMAALLCAVVVGSALTALVNAMVKDILTPVIAAVFGGTDFNSLTFEINHSTFRYGHLINEFISFLILAFVTFFMLILPLRRALAFLKPKRKTTECVECLEKITKGARRCKFCASVQPVAGDSDSEGEKLV
ncbi:mechanosensitive ion channel [Raphidocelis subcapitata]|uniref:Mechanosensitive ion channel n=1 Tax=Raphidocelis subcapitata TaxID=307507 RepID=A0A2V0PHL7_9CHLO|nr:mechanosensitive ion channel [Raphidocelis subcapitata]|eukprot:GBF99314.1 mechanosensitive ion channel [Raphidocelis subcapitata]